MTAQRLIQNFRQGRGILWAGADFHHETLERTLLKLGVTLTRFEAVDVSALDSNRDVLFIEGDQAINPALLLGTGSTMPLAPVIGIVGMEAPSRLKLLSDAGATAFLRKPIHAASVYSALFLGVNNYRRLRGMELRLAEQDRKRHGRRFIIKAVVALVQAQGLTDDQAYAALRHESMRRRLGIEEFCEALFGEGSSFPAQWPPHAEPGSSPHQQENTNATDIADGCRDAGHDGPDGGQGRGPDQARRA